MVGIFTTNAMELAPHRALGRREDAGSRHLEPTFLPALYMCNLACSVARYSSNIPRSDISRVGLNALNGVIII